MVASERYEREVLRGLRRAQGASEDEQLSAVLELFSSYLTRLPRPAREEICGWYAERHAEGDARVQTIEALALRLAAIIDVFDQAYEEDRTPLEHDEWELIRSLSNEHSPQMELETLRYVMQLLMDHGEMG